MKIRSLTWFIDPSSHIDKKVASASTNVNKLRNAFTEAGIEVQTTRLATTPFPAWLDIDHPAKAMVKLQNLEDIVRASGFDYASIGPALPDMPVSYEVIPDILGTTGLFASAIMTPSDGGLDTRAVKACARIIRECSCLSSDGFTNLRFTALGNVPPGSPFFPSAYAHPGKLGFGIAVEGADLAVEAFSDAKSAEDAQSRLVNRINTAAVKLQNVCKSADETLNLIGIDFTMAPFPDDEVSIGKALENLGLPAFGEAGSLAAASILMSAMGQAKFPRTGFNGLMLPVLEDSILAKRAADGSLGVQDILLYSAVCGTGLDTIPLPGDTSEEQLYAILLDVGALSLRLHKPLTARLMPIPGKSIGDATEFEFGYFANSRVMDPDAGQLYGLLAMDGIIPIHGRS